MPTPPLSPEKAQEALDALAACGGNQSEAAAMLGISRGTFVSRVNRAQGMGVTARPVEHGWTFPLNIDMEIDTGTVVISSDHHYWPEQNPVAHRALLEVIKLVKPRLKILNGDIFDGGTIGRHPPLGWSTRPTPVQELHACQEKIGEIEQALPRGCERIWNVGNHDQRFERVLASRVPEFANLQGMRLEDHFDGWNLTHSLWINRRGVNPVMVFHNFANGVHAGYNNAMKGGCTVVTGHTHALEVKPYSNLIGRHFGIQCGTVCDLDAPQFEYQGNRPSQACSGFAVLTFHEGVLVPPEICQVINGKAWFRGEVVAHD